MRYLLRQRVWGLVLILGLTAVVAFYSGWALDLGSGMCAAVVLWILGCGAVVFRREWLRQRRDDDDRTRRGAGADTVYDRRGGSSLSAPERSSDLRAD